jgi:hypothetical protein
MVLAWIPVDQPGLMLAIVTEKRLQNQSLAGRCRTLPECPWCPEEDPNGARRGLDVNQKIIVL